MRRSPPTPEHWACPAGPRFAGRPAPHPSRAVASREAAARAPRHGAEGRHAPAFRGGSEAESFSSAARNAPSRPAPAVWRSRDTRLVCVAWAAATAYTAQASRIPCRCAGCPILRSRRAVRTRGLGPSSLLKTPLRSGRHFQGACTVRQNHRRVVSVGAHQL